MYSQADAWGSLLCCFGGTCVTLHAYRAHDRYVNIYVCVCACRLCVCICLFGYFGSEDS